VTQSEIEEVAKSVNAHDFILSLPDGYDTQVSSSVSHDRLTLSLSPQVGEGGQMLSGGQRARVAL
jgi:ATP-binding cassette, subfamily B, bacterial MsbA